MHTDCSTSPRRLSYVPVVRVSLVRESRLPVEKKAIRAPGDAAAILREMLADADREMLVALLLDCRNQVIGVHTISVGTVDSSLIHPRETFKAAILAGATGIVLGHNHPSGEVDPSPEDVATTKRASDAGKILGIEVLDHVIIGDCERWASLKERNLL